MRKMNGIEDAVKSEWFLFVGRAVTLIGVPLLVLLVSWQLNKQAETQGSIEKLGDRMTVLEIKMDYTATDPYHGQDAKRDFALRDEMLTTQGSKLDDYESRLKALELTRAQRK